MLEQPPRDVPARLHGHHGIPPEVEREPYVAAVPMVESTHYLSEMDPRFEPQQFELDFEPDDEDWSSYDDHAHESRHQEA